MFRTLLFLGSIAFVLGQSAWQSMVDDELIGAGLAHAAIIGIDGKIWAKSSGFSVSWMIA